MTENNSQKKLNVALFLSGLVFPGTGQFYLKRHLRGALIIILTLGGTLIGLFGFLKSIQEIMAQNQIVLTNHLVTISTIMKAYEGFKTTLILCALITFLSWLYGLIDILFSMLTSPTTK